MNNACMYLILMNVTLVTNWPYNAAQPSIRVGIIIQYLDTISIYRTM